MNLNHVEGSVNKFSKIFVSHQDCLSIFHHRFVLVFLDLLPDLVSREACPKHLLARDRSLHLADVQPEAQDQDQLMDGGGGGQGGGERRPAQEAVDERCDAMQGRTRLLIGRGKVQVRN